MAAKPTHFWCNGCQAWTRVAGGIPGSGFGCSRCGEEYLCGECGYDIDRAGNCRRPEGHEHPEPTPIPRPRPTMSAADSMAIGDWLDDHGVPTDAR